MNNHDWLSSLKHMFKLDPNRPITEEMILKLCQSKTDAFVIGGTLGITYEDTLDLLKKVRKYNMFPVIQEISNLEAVVPGFDYYFIPLVLNAQNPKWILNAHLEAIKKYGDLINWNQVVVEGYIILNGDSSVANLTESNVNLDLDDIIAYGRMADQLLKLPIIYIEYSGKYGEPYVLQKMKSSIQQAKIFYGGGIDSNHSAIEMGQYADTIIVGNLIYDDFARALETVINKKIV